jgi:hypothetical protein
MSVSIGIDYFYTTSIEFSYSSLVIINKHHVTVVHSGSLLTPVSFPVKIGSDLCEKIWEPAIVPTENDLTHYNKKFDPLSRTFI